MRRFTYAEVEELLSVGCTLCGQPKGKWCVYMLPRNLGEFVYTPAQQARVARAGTPTKQCHSARYDAVRARRHRRHLADRRPAVVPPSRTSLDILAATREHDARERAQLRAWLAQHAGLLLRAAS